MSANLTPALAAIHYERDFDINGMLRKVVKSLQEKGVIVGGVLQETEFRPNGYCAQLNIVDIRTGKTERITQDRGRDSRGCKLDCVYRKPKPGRNGDEARPGSGVN